MSRDFAFIQTTSGRVFVGWGPFEQLPFRRPDRPAFFVTDFFLDEPRPWLHPAEWEEMPIETLAMRLDEEAPAEAEWKAASRDAFASSFASAQNGIARNDFKKIVPIAFEHARFVGNPAGFVSRLTSLPQGLWAYGVSSGTSGVIGATPEVLFQSHGRGYRTMALAGTRPISRAHELLTSTKEMREHRFVVDDIARRLAPFGNVEIGALGIMNLPSIAHLITPIFFMESGDERMSFAEMIRRLHPTAALGVSPRTEAGERWLREADRGVQRRFFGAPFGLEREDHFAIALVGIRNIEWEGEWLRVGAGAGVIAESTFELEAEELQHKRDQVKALFGLRASIEAWT
jgi:menaquinone-specific isochorismate synthase